jgi:hypothetical protein
MTIGGTPVVILFGGTWLGPEDADVHNVSDDTWMWNGVSWTLLSPPNRPPALQNPYLAADPSGTKLVLFGGENVMHQESDQTYTFDGTTWTDRTGAIKPPARQDASMATDVVNNGVALFGGLQDGSYTNDLWLFSTLSNTWTMLQPTSAFGTCLAFTSTVRPCERGGAALASDPDTNGLVLFGGNAGYADTWVWNGAAWSKKTPVHSPPTREFAAFARFDADTSILFGGEPAADPEAWSWDGTDWTDLDRGPASRAAMHMALLDSTASRTAKMVVFGGVSTDGARLTYDDTWSYDPTAPGPPPPPPPPPPRPRGRRCTPRRVRRGAGSG